MSTMHQYRRVCECVCVYQNNLRWKVFFSKNLRHSAPLEMPFPMVSFLDGVKFFRFWLKTMDYSKAFSFCSPLEACVCVCCSLPPSGRMNVGRRIG